MAPYLPGSCRFPGFCLAHHLEPSDMGQRWTILGHPEWDIEFITLGRRRTFRLRRFGVLVVYCPTVAALEQVLDQYGFTTADMVEVEAP